MIPALTTQTPRLTRSPAQVLRSRALGGMGVTKPDLVIAAGLAAGCVFVVA